MLNTVIEQDKILRELMKRSKLTEAQWDTLLLYNLRNLKLKDKCKLRDNVEVSKGAFLRTYKQAIDNCMKAAFTMITLEYLGLCKEGSLEGLSKLSQMLSSSDKRFYDKDKVFFIIENLERIIKEMLIVK
ncbi:MAG: hypothetical protein QXX95_07215 [Nitrososphaerales archaeon]